MRFTFVYIETPILVDLKNFNELAKMIQRL